MKMNKKFMTLGILGMFSLMLVTGALLSYYGQINQEINVERAVVLSDGNYNPIEDVNEEEYDKKIIENSYIIKEWNSSWG